MCLTKGDPCVLSRNVGSLTSLTKSHASTEKGHGVVLFSQQALTQSMNSTDCDRGNQWRNQRQLYFHHGVRNLSSRGLFSTRTKM